jgi:hypothetical protein
LPSLGVRRPSSVVCRLLSVACKLFTFQASSPKPLGQLEPSLAGNVSSQSIRNIIKAESNFGDETGETICFTENITSLPIFTQLSTSSPSIFSQRIYMFFN